MVENEIAIDNGKPTPSGWKIGAGVNGQSFFRVSKEENGSASELFRIKDNGNVGIGFTDPQEKLHVVGKIFAENLKLSGSSAQSFSSTDPGIYHEMLQGILLQKARRRF